MTAQPFPPAARDLQLDDIAVGDCLGFDVTVSEADVEQFAALTGDRSPIHMDRETARRAGFADRVVHGMLTASVASTVCGMLVPGRRATLASVKSDFLQPVLPGTRLTVSAKVAHVSEAVRSVTLSLVTYRSGLPVLRQQVVARVRAGD